ncbi:YtxH domain-containing protein [Peribacillus muralis]|uniref:YtxH domain-containing protein n=1 Tax=Peribacillus muralis TaxID=264697 RepID=UPI0007091BCA|nr:YtxH domain-containing protein [Peribacillus muralis]
MTQKEYPTKDYQKTYEDERDSINSKDFMIGALIGGMIGAATALFMAPKTGKELRNDFNEQAKNITEKTEKLRQTAMEKGTVLADTAKEKTTSVTEIVSNKSSDIVNKVKSLKSVKENGDAADDTTNSSNKDIDVTGTSDSPIVSVETNFVNGNDAENKPADPTSGNKNTAKLKLDEAKKAFDETENKLKK